MANIRQLQHTYKEQWSYIIYNYVHIHQVYTKENKGAEKQGFFDCQQQK